MGTNYYVIDSERVCPECGNGNEKIHIGKSSLGWCFSLHVIPEMDLNTLEDWKEYLRYKPIEDEYSAPISYSEMIDTITNRESDNIDEFKKQVTDGTYISIMPKYDTWEDFLNQNHAVDGPNNLLRHKIGDHCIGHGEGTWDYIKGEFS